VSAILVDNLDVVKYMIKSGYSLSDICNNLNNIISLLNNNKQRETVRYLQDLCYNQGQRGGSTNISNKQILVEAIILIIIIILASVFHL
jgi:hypothetical protein